MGVGGGMEGREEGGGGEEVGGAGGREGEGRGAVAMGQDVGAGLGPALGGDREGSRSRAVLCITGGAEVATLPDTTGSSCWGVTLGYALGTLP